MRTAIATLTTGALLALAAGFPATPVHAAAKVDVKFAHAMPISGHQHKGALAFKEHVEKGSDRFNVNVYPAGQLYTDKGLVGAVTSGTLDLAFAVASRWEEVVPAMSIFDFPTLLGSYARANAALEGEMGRTLAAQIEKHDVKFLGWIDFGVLNAIVNTVRPIRTVADFKGLKLRTFNPMHANFLKELGVAPVVMSSSEVYLALQRGTIDGTLSGTTSTLQRKWSEVVKYATIMPVSYQSHPLVASRRFWDTLPAADQKLFAEAAGIAAKRTRKMAEEDDSKAYQTLKGIVQVEEMKPDAEKAVSEVAVRLSSEYLNGVAGKAGLAVLAAAQKDIKNVK